jgi:type II secretory pathway pseudopilin PulG
MVNPKSKIRISKQARIPKIQISKRSGYLNVGILDLFGASDLGFGTYPPRLLGRGGFALPLVIVVMVILIILTAGAMMTSYSSRLQAVKTKAETEAMLAAEAGYERAIFWMCQQTDILGAIQLGGGSGNINFGTSRCSYQVQFQDFMGARPVFHVVSTGISGRPTFTRVVDVSVMQETSGWAMGACRVPNGTTSTTGVYFGSNEVIDMPLHINKYNDSPDVRDIWIQNGDHPRFLGRVEMGESRKAGATDKYSTVMSCFEDGIAFDQPGVRITNEGAVQSKVDRFHDSTATAYRFTPTASGSVSQPRYAAVHLQFYISGGVGMVKITNNCTVKGTSAGPSDYNVVPGTGGAQFHTYSIYAHQFDPCTGSITVPITNTYVTQTFGGYTSEPGGQIYVNGNVVIGSADYNEMVVKGKITVVATGNIWVADSIKVDDNGGAQRDASGMPSQDNPNVLGLIAQGVIKVVDPGKSPSSTPSAPSGYIFTRVCNGSSPTSNTRWLPDPTVVEAAITVGGGGWGAENVNTSGGRKVYSTPQDDLYVRGSITEVVRGIVGHLGSDGYVKHYYADTRLMSGILPGDIWFSGKYIPAPAGWHDRSIHD